MKHALAAQVLAVTLLISGCATSSPIERYTASKSHFRNLPELISQGYPEKDTYRIYHRGATSFVSIQSLRETAEQRAEDFSRRQGKSMIVLGERISQPPYILGNFPRIEIVFALTDAAAVATAPQRDKYDEIERLKKLWDEGALTQEEFAREKEKLLNP